MQAKYHNISTNEQDDHSLAKSTNLVLAMKLRVWWHILKSLEGAMMKQHSYSSNHVILLSV